MIVGMCGVVVWTARAMKHETAGDEGEQYTETDRFGRVCLHVL